MTVDCSNLLNSLANADWATVQKTIGNNHSTIVGVLAAWYIGSSSGSGTLIEGAPSFSIRGSKPFKSDGLFCEGENDSVVGILEVEGSRHEHTIKKVRKHFQSNSDILKGLWFAVYVAYPELPKGRAERRCFPNPLGETEFNKFCELSKEHPNKCIVVITLRKQYERERSEVRKKTEYYSGRVNGATAKLYQNGQVVDERQLFGAGA